MKLDKLTRAAVAWIGLALATFLCLLTIVARADTSADSDRAPVKVERLGRTAPKPGTTFRECPDCPVMMVVPSGHFVMGSPPTEYGRYDVEGPQHSVTFRRAFAVGLYDVTRGEYATFIAETHHSQAGGCRFGNPEAEWANVLSYGWNNVGFAQSGRDPVLCVNLDDAHAYIAWLNAKVTGRAAGAPGRTEGPYRLLSEAEFEYAARAGATTAYPWGPKASHDFANYGLDECGPCGPAVAGRDRWLFTSPVGSFPPNAFGLYDMSGDAWTWVADCWHPSYDGAPTDGSAWIGPNCTHHEMKGGGWLDPPHYLRVATRADLADDTRSQQLTIRVARDLPMRNVPE